MKKLTAMQELIKRLRVNMKDRPTNSNIAMGIAIALDLATELLETEKQIIIDAVNEGLCGNMDAKEYFNQTFNK